MDGWVYGIFSVKDDTTKMRLGTPKAMMQWKGVSQDTREAYLYAHHEKENGKLGVSVILSPPTSKPCFLITFWTVMEMVAKVCNGMIFPYHFSSLRKAGSYCGVWSRLPNFSPLHLTLSPSSSSSSEFHIRFPMVAGVGRLDGSWPVGDLHQAPAVCFHMVSFYGWMPF